jgi:hypothetical protein
MVRWLTYDSPTISLVSDVEIIFLRVAVLTGVITSSASSGAYLAQHSQAHFGTFTEQALKT